MVVLPIDDEPQAPRSGLTVGELHLIPDRAFWFLQRAVSLM